MPSAGGVLLLALLALLIGCQLRSRQSRNAGLLKDREHSRKLARKLKLPSGEPGRSGKSGKSGKLQAENTGVPVQQNEPHACECSGQL